MPIFWDSVFKHRTLFSRKGIVPTVAICSPIFLIFIPLFLYNYFRFGNILDFGSNYNLTGFDMTNSNQPILSVLPLVFYYLFQPGSIIGHFPFVSLTNIPVLTWFPMEPSVGGIFMIAPFFLLIIFMHWIRNRDVSLQQSTNIKTNNSILAILQNINIKKLFTYIFVNYWRIHLGSRCEDRWICLALWHWFPLGLVYSNNAGALPNRDNDTSICPKTIILITSTAHCQCYVLVPISVFRIIHH